MDTVVRVADEGDRGQEFAEGLLRRALEDEDNFVREVASASIARLSKDQQEWALREFSERVDNGGASLPSRRAAVQALGTLRTDEARAKLLQLITDGTSEGLVTTAVLSLARSTDGEVALREFEILIAAAPQDGVLRGGLSLCLAGQGRKEEAIEAALEAVELLPNDAQLRTQLGDLHTQMSKYPEAIVSYRRAIELDATYPEAHWGLAAALFGLEDMEQALAVARARSSWVRPQGIPC